jgi:hypothetical protein
VCVGSRAVPSRRQGHDESERWIERRAGVLSERESRWRKNMSAK